MLDNNVIDAYSATRRYTQMTDHTSTCAREWVQLSKFTGRLILDAACPRCQQLDPARILDDSDCEEVEEEDW